MTISTVPAQLDIMSCFDKDNRSRSMLTSILLGQGPQWLLRLTLFIAFTVSRMLVGFKEQDWFHVRI